MLSGPCERRDGAQAPSLYRTMAREVTASPTDPPSTIETRTAETLDGDIVSAIAVGFDDPHPSPTPRPSPGTTATFTVETIDNDSAAVATLIDPEPRPRPTPGTGITATIETMDEHNSVVLALMNE